MTLPRWMHRLYAFLFSYFWLPCPSCGRPFGGHERGGGIMWVGGGLGKILCPHCPNNMGYDGLFHPEDGPR